MCQTHFLFLSKDPPMSQTSLTQDDGTKSILNTKYQSYSKDEIVLIALSSFNSPIRSLTCLMFPKVDKHADFPSEIQSNLR